MTLDIRGSLKNTKINKNPHTCIDELISNAIDSYLIRKDREPSLQGLNISIHIELFPRDLFGEDVDFKVTCTDNGAGFGVDQIKAFVTKDTSYKDDLSIDGIGKCRGSGRIQFLHYFNELSIDSVVKESDRLLRRRLKIDVSSAKEITESMFSREEVMDVAVHTSVELNRVKAETYDKLYRGKELVRTLSADELRLHVIVNFLQRLISLKDSLGAFKIEIQSKYQEHSTVASVSSKDLPKVTNRRNVSIEYPGKIGEHAGKTESFELSHYTLDIGQFNVRRNLIAFCAKSSIVKAVTSRYLKPRAVENSPVGGCYHLVLIESNYLSKHVNPQRDDFDIPIESSHEQEDLFPSDQISFELIYQKLDDIVDEWITPPDWSRDTIVISVAKKYGISSSMITESNVQVRFGDTEERVVQRVLASCQAQIIQDTGEIFQIQHEISNTDPTSSNFRERINDLAWKYTSSLKYIDMTNLSQLIVRRSAILEVLNLAIKQNLQVQTLLPNSSERRCDEKIIHQIFFPMGKDSMEATDHDTWLLSEEYHYFDYIASNKALSSIHWDENSLLFESDIDEELSQIMKKNYHSNSAKRPDIALFSREGAAIIIEFKAPDVSLDDHTNDLMEYAQLLAAKSNGKLNRFFGYLLGTKVNPNRLRGYKPFPARNGWFGTEEISEHKTGRRLGELYSEILFYEDVVARANMRLDVYRKRLGIDFTPH